MFDETILDRCRGSQSMGLIVTPVDRAHRYRFYRPSWIGRNDMEWFVDCGEWLPRDDLRPPLLALEQADLADRRVHPFYRDAEAEMFLARLDGQVVGRIAAIVGHPFRDGDRVSAAHQGYFGFYEAIDDQAVAGALLGAAAAWLRGRGLTHLLGPASPSHNYYFGARCLGDEVPPHTPTRFLETYDPEYHHRHFTSWGLAPARRLLGYDCYVGGAMGESIIARFDRAINRTIDYTGLTIRALDLDNFDADISLATDLLNRSLAENWGFTPMSPAELLYMAAQLKPLIDPTLVLFAELEGEPVGISLAMPDYNQVFAAMEGRLRHLARVFTFENLPLLRRLWPNSHPWAHRRIDSARVIALGVVPTLKQGTRTTRREQLRIGPALIYRTFTNLRDAGYDTLTASWILEENRAMRAPMQIAGIEPSRVWRIYACDLAAV